MKQNHTKDRGRMSATELRAALSLALIFFLRMLGLFMITPIMALHAGQLGGATATLVGIAIGVYGLTQAAFQIPFGAWSDRWGRKPVIAIGLVIFALGSAVAALADDIILTIVGRALQGAGAVGSATLALAADLTGEEQRVKAMAIIGITIGLAFPIAFVSGPALGAGFGTPSVFWFAALLGIAAIAVLYTLVPRAAQLRFHRDCEYQPAQFRDIIRDRQLLRLDYGVFTLHLILTGTFVVTPVALRDELSLATAEHWRMYLPALAVSILMLGFMIGQAERRGRMKQMFATNVVLLAVSQLGLYWLHADLLGMVGALTLFFTAVNFLEASLPSLISRLAPAAGRGTAMGIYSTSQFLGIFVGGALGGWLHGHAGLGAVYLMNLLLAVAWGITTYSLPARYALANRMLRVGPLSAQEATAMTAKLLAVAGVAEAVVISGDEVAYLKVEPDKLNAAALTALGVQAHEDRAEARPHEEVTEIS